ncbi:NAD(P)H-binding protein [Aestuariivirga sp. YIM B02566]|uniref:NAD(P)H-binding protein n=1 Tax=Taklimakanibacter albus TaxID=2800327 RepID=A0ACC5QYA3_9HYPH|nr:NAD(P)H-binding protein [Aestuariivirga sp. YIM B02566]MBK1865377.1 NAD(P)H-binding protein [Aestuariivirga sp. YIM B02566]
MYFVTGASGKLGQLVAAELAQQGTAADVTLGSRNPDKLASYAQQGFKTARFDFDAPDSMRAALAGHDRLLLISGDAPVDERIRQHKAAIDAAKAADVKLIAYTSFTNASAKSLFTFARIHAETEAYIKASGLAYRFLRDNQYAENIASAVAHAKETGAFAVYGSKGKVAYVTRADVAKAAVAALLTPPNGGETFEITGPRAYDAAEIAEILNRKWGKPVAAAELPRDVLVAIFKQLQWPPFVIEAVVSLHEATAAGELASASGDYQRLTGKAPESLADFLARTA